MKIEIKESKFYVNLPVSLYQKIKEISYLNDNINLAMLGLLLHFILSKKYKNKNYEDGSEWTTLNATILNKYNHGKHKTKTHLDILVYHKIIERKNHFVNLNLNKSQSRGYKINPNFFIKQELSIFKKNIYDKSYSFCSTQLTKKLIRHQNQRRIKADYKCEHLTKWLNNSGFEIDTNKATDYVNKKYSTEKDKYKREKRIQAISSFTSYQKAYSREGKDDRLHSYFTALPSDLKQFITYKGQKLKEADIKSSQPFILSFILEVIQKEYLIEIKRYSSISHKRFSNKLYNRFSSLISSRYVEEYSLDIRSMCINITIMLEKTSETSDFTEINSFISLVRQGDIYAFLGNHLLKIGTIWQKENKYYVNLFDDEKGYNRIHEFKSLRDCSKKITINSLYSSTKKSGVKAIEEFRLFFPKVTNFLNVMKQNDKSELPILMQQIESHFILDNCSKKIAHRLPKTPLLSRHDSLITVESDFGRMKSEFKKLLKTYFKVEVDLGEESW
jgi:hypothetical protein